MLETNPYQLKNLIQEINKLYQEKLKKIDSEVVLSLQMPNNSCIYFLITKEGIKELEAPFEKKTLIEIKYNDFLRLVKDPSKVVKYLLDGKIKIKGDFAFIKDFIKILKPF
ncbi:MAG: SCP2 sterol-binding domain-containing protein [Caldimicrobium sp.]